MWYRVGIPACKQNEQNRKTKQTRTTKQTKEPYKLPSRRTNRFSKVKQSTLHTTEEDLLDFKTQFCLVLY